MCLIHEVDIQRSEAFAERMVGVLNDGALSIMLSLGHRTKLFEAMKENPGATSEEIAAAAGLNERYVREWLGAMTTGKIVDVDAVTRRYTLPEEHSAFLTGNTADNIGVFAQYIPLLGTVEEKIIDCFKNGGGVPYTEYKRFHQVMSEDSSLTVVGALLDTLIPSIPGLPEKLEAGINVIDLGCGRGKALHLLASTYPESTFTGCDLSDEAIHHAKESAAEKGLKNVTFLRKDLTDFHQSAEENRYDLVFTFDAVHDQARPDNLLAGIHKTLKEDGIYFMQDISGSSEHYNNMDHPLGTLLYTISTMHCMTVSLAQNGMGLGAMWGREKAVEMLQDAGFATIERKNFDHDTFNDYYIVRKR